MALLTLNRLQKSDGLMMSKNSTKNAGKEIFCGFIQCQHCFDFDLIDLIKFIIHPCVFLRIVY